MRKTITTLLAFGLAGAQGMAAASGFAITENSASGMGNAFAGAAASAEDASTIWFNPAGMMKLQGSQVVVGLHVIHPEASFTNKGSTTASGIPLSGGNDDGGQDALVPNFYWLTGLNERTRFGLGINAPFGLRTEYDDTWVGRYHAVKTELRTLNINPSIAFQANERLALGGGIDILLVNATFTNAIDFGALLGNPQAADGFADLDADNVNGLSDLAYGFNLGLTYDLGPQTTLGLAYRSEIDIDVAGDADFSVPLAAAPVLSSGAFQHSTISAAVTLPQSLSLSIAQQLDRFTLLADITWTGWNSFDELRIRYGNPKQPDSVTTENWENSLRYSVGLDWHYSKQLTLRTGLAYDESPVPDAAHRTPRIPGNDRTWLSLGGSYVIDDAFTIDVGYSHLFVSNTGIDIENTFESSQPALAATLRGNYDSSVDILSAQLRWNY